MAVDPTEAIRRMRTLDNWECVEISSPTVTRSFKVDRQSPFLEKWSQGVRWQAVTSLKAERFAADEIRIEITEVATE